MSRFLRRSWWIVAAVAVLVACSGGNHAPMAEAFEVETSAAGGNFSAHLTGGQEVPPANTRAQGQANFWLSRDGTELRFRVNVANIENVTMAHIHLAPAGVNGPVVAWLYPAGPPAQLIPGRSHGPLAEGVLTAANLVGPLAGSMTLEDLVDALRSGNAYVNVHTSQFPGGEVRGQIR